MLDIKSKQTLFSVFIGNESCGLNIRTVLCNIASEEVQEPFIHQINVFAVMQSHESTFRSRMLCSVQYSG